MSTKLCPVCHQVKPLTEFDDAHRKLKSGEKRVGKKTYCKSCANEKHKSWARLQWTDPQKRQKALAYSRDYAKKIKQSSPDSDLRMRHQASQFNHWAGEIGDPAFITPDELRAHLNRSGYKCDICGKSEIVNKKRLAIDHQHGTSIIRGLLCSECNFWLAVLERPAWVKQACLYLQKTSQISDKILETPVISSR